MSSNRVAIGYENGEIVVYEIGTKNRNELNAIALLTNGDLFNPDKTSYSDKTGILKMATDNKRQYLFAVNSQHGIDVWDVSHLESKNPENKIRSRPDTSFTSFSELKGHTGEVSCLSFSSDNKMLLSGSNDHTAILWDISTKDIKKSAILKGPNASEIKFADFFNKDKNIITVSGNNDKGNIDKVYLWKIDRPSVLHAKNQLYRFSAFSYAMWGLDRNKEFKPRDSTFSTEFSNLLNYILTIPLENEYPNDKWYNNVRENSFNEMEAAYNKLVNKKNYNDSVENNNRNLLEKCYNVFFLNTLNESYKSQKSDMPPGIEGHILRAKTELIEWKIFLADTSKKSEAPGISFILLTASSYLDKKGNYTDGLRFVRFCNDSIWQPLRARYGESSYLQAMKRIIDVYWVKYYLYTGKPDEAMRVANELSQIPSKTIDNRIYLVATYLVSDKYDSAVSIYNEIIKNRLRRRDNDRNLLSLLNRLKEKHIALSNIVKFNNEVELELE